MFRSVVILRNLTCWDSANIEHPLRILSLAGKQDDLCQLHIEGSDAELACMVLMDFIAEHFMLVNTAHRSNKHANLSLLRGLSTFRLPFEIDYHFARDSSNDKTAILEQVANLTAQVNSAEMTQTDFPKFSRLKGKAVCFISNCRGSACTSKRSVWN